MTLKAVGYLICLSLFIYGCDELTSDHRKLKAELMKADIEFSDLSRQKGMKNAFIEYIEDEGILLRPNHPPMVGAEAIDYLSVVDDSAVTLTWIPSAAQVSKSGDMGFTYGIYTLKAADTTIRGTYVNIWKQKKGKWKFVLDSGNEGLGNQNQNTE